MGEVHVDDLLQRFDNAFERSGLYNIQIGAQRKTGFNILWIVGSGVDDYGQVVEVLVAPDFFETFDTVFYGHVQIEKYQVGECFPGEVPHQLFTILCEGEKDGSCHEIGGLRKQQSIIGVIIRKKYMCTLFVLFKHRFAQLNIK